MESNTFSLAELSRMGKVDSILGYEVVADGTVKGKISNLLRDKYGRLSGVEIEFEEKSAHKHTAVPYNKIDSVDEIKKIVNANI